MAQVTTPGVVMQGIVASVPDHEVSVRELGAALPAAELDKIVSTVGLGQVFRVKAGQTAADLCRAAAEQLLQDLEWAPESVDGLIFVTQTPDHFLPANACILHARLGLSPSALAFDINMGCSGYVQALLVATQLVTSGTCRRLLLLAGDTISPLLDPSDQSVALLFGDAGSATALEARADANALAFVSGTDGRGWERLRVPGGGFRHPNFGLGVAPASSSPRWLSMDGLAVYEFTLRRVPSLIRDVLHLQDWNADEVDAFLLHQANGFMLEALRKKLHIPTERWPVNIARYGNTSMVTIPLLLADDLSVMLRSSEQNLVLAGFGVGFSWAAMAGRLGPLRTARVIRVQ